MIAHPAYKALLRGVLDTQNRPIFQEGCTGVPGGGQGPVVDTVFGYPVKWSLGARTNTTVSSAPTGNKLLIFGNPAYLYLGVRSGPESGVHRRPQWSRRPHRRVDPEDAVASRLRRRRGGRLLDSRAAGLMRRAPIPEPGVGAHRPETVAGRLAVELVDNVTHLTNLGGRMASLDDTLARLDAVVAAAVDVQATARAAAEAEAAAQVDERVAALEAAFGITPEPAPAS